MTRMVEEERVPIGTHKALGYRNATIISKYFVYAFVASAAGAVVGIGVFSQLLPSLIIRAYGTIYAIPVVVTPLDIPIALASFGLGVGITVGTTWLAAAATLRESPAALMLPRAPKPGKRILLERIGPLWRRLSFTGKVTARNLFRYKRRFFMAVIGIAGCTALLLTGLGLHDGINDILGKQFGELLHYNMTVQVDKDQTNAEGEATLETIGQSPLVERMTAVQMEPAIVRSANSDKDERATTVVPQDAAELPEYVTLRTRQGHEPLCLGDEGAIVSEKLASQLGVGVGDTIEVFGQNSVGDATGEGHPVKVAGVAEYYTGQYVYLTPGCYEAAYGEAPVFTSYLAAAPGTLEQRTGLQNQLLDIGHVQVVSYYDEVVGTYQKMLETVDSVVWTLGRGGGCARLCRAVQPDQHQHHRAHTRDRDAQGARLHARRGECLHLQGDVSAHAVRRASRLRARRGHGELRHHDGRSRPDDVRSRDPSLELCHRVRLDACVLVARHAVHEAQARPSRHGGKPQVRRVINMQSTERPEAQCLRVALHYLTANNGRTFA